MRHTLLHRIAVGSGALTVALTTAFGGVAVADESPTSGASTAQQHDDQPAPKFTVSAKFDKSEYHVSDQITGSITVTNTGTATAHAVHVIGDGDNLDFNSIGWSDIWPGTPGIDIAPGQVVTRTFGGTVKDSAKPVKITADLMADPAAPGRVTDTDVATAAILAGKGSVDGTLYADTNNNGAYDPGEGLAGVQVTFSGGAPYHSEPPVKTDKDGHFALPDVPSGTYYPSYDGLGDLVGPVTAWQFDEGTSKVVLQARHKVSDTLTATTKLTADTYKVGDLAHVTVTMKNSGDQPLTGIGVRCNRIGDSNQLSGRTDSWGDLRDVSAGVTVPAHSTITLDVSEAVPDGARGYGYVVVDCDFGQFKYGFEDGRLSGTPDRVHVPGAIANVAGSLDNVKDNTEAAGVKFYVVDEISHQPVANTVTDAKGAFKFTGLPAGLYRTVLVGPWKLSGDQSPLWNYVEGTRDGENIAVEPGPDQPDPYPPTQPTAPTAPAPQASPVLANTGAADVPSMIGTALGALVIGVGLVLLSRRRRTS